MLFGNLFVMIGDRSIVFTEGVIRWEWRFTFREFGVGIVMLQSVENVAMLVESVGFVFVLVDTHLQEPLSRSKKLDIKAIADGFFKFLFNGVIASSVEHVIDKEEKA